MYSIRVQARRIYNRAHKDAFYWSKENKWDISEDDKKKYLERLEKIEKSIIDYDESKKNNKKNANKTIKKNNIG